MRHIGRSLFALALCAGAAANVAVAQDSTRAELLAGLLVTTGIEGAQPRSSVASLPNAACPLTPNQVTAARAGVGTAFVGGNAYLYHYFKKAWWSGERAPHFFFHADWDQEFRDQDKFGHLLGGYHLARIGYAGMREACVGEKKAIFWSAAYAAAFQLQIEIFDGQFKKYGFSYADMIANTAGQAFAVMQELPPAAQGDQADVFISRDARAQEHRHGTVPELAPPLDYSGQTYWFSADVNELLPDAAKPYWPSFIRFSAGHSVTDWINPETGAAQRAKRKIMLSLDFDPEKLPGNAPLWRTIKHTLSYYHFPRARARADAQAASLALVPVRQFGVEYRQARLSGSWARRFRSCHCGRRAVGRERAGFGLCAAR